MSNKDRIMHLSNSESIDQQIIKDYLIHFLSLPIQEQ